MKNYFYPSVFFLIIALSLCFTVKGQDNNSFFWRGKVINGDTGDPVPNAIIAVYSRSTLYSADIDGIIKLRLQENDSVRVVVLGYSAETFRINSLHTDSTGHSIMRIFPVSYLLKEVTIRGHKGILNPDIFPKFEDDGPKINMNLPKDIGSRMSKEPPPYELIDDSFQISELLFAVKSPVSYIYSKFDKEEKQLKMLREAKYHKYNEERLKDYISPEAIALITGYEGEELQKFIIYCNAKLIITHNDTAASITMKIEEIFRKYKEELSTESSSGKN